MNSQRPLNNGRRMMRRISLVVLGALASALAAPSWGHHSFAQFEMGKDATIAGTVKEFDWTNPHTWLVVNVKDASGKAVEWRLEGASVNELARAGWTRRLFQPGDRVTVQIHPLRGGAPGGAFASVTTSDGKIYGQTTREATANP